MPPLRNLKPRQVVRILEHNGFLKTRQTGSHAIYSHGSHHVTVPIQNKPLPIATIQKIIKHTGLPLDLFLTKAKR